MKQWESSQQQFAPWAHLGEGQELRVPYRGPAPRSDWATPLLQALTLSITVSVAVAGVLWATEDATTRQILVTAGLVFIFSFLGAFWWRVRRADESMFHRLKYPRARPEPQDLRPIISSSRGRFENPQEAPATVAQNEAADVEDEIDDCIYQRGTMAWFVYWAEISGTGSAVWEKPLGRKRYRGWRDSLIEAGWAEWNSYSPDGSPNHTQGWTLLAPASEICRHIRQ